MLILNNEELESVCDMPSCIDALHAGIKQYALGNACRRPRIDLFTPTARPDEYACFSTMDGLIRGGYYALRIKPDIMSWPVVEGVRRRVTYSSRPGLYGGLVLLFRAENAEVVAIMNDGYVQHMRVGALAALGARYLSRAEAGVVGILGSGGMARSFALGFAAVRPIRQIKVYSPTPERRRAFCAELSARLQIEVTPVPDAESAFSGSDIVATCTNSMEPVIHARLLEPGMYVANVTNRELGLDLLQRDPLVGYLLERTPLDLTGFADHNFDVRMDCMAYLSGSPDERERIPRGGKAFALLSRARRTLCVDWETGQPRSTRRDDDITFLAELSGSNTHQLSSDGIQGIQFAAVAGRAYELAAARGLGRELPTELFLQDIPT